MLRLVLLIVSCLALINAAYVWELVDALGDTPDPRYHHVVAWVNTSTIVLFGGFDFDNGGVYLDDTWVFDLDTNTWSEVVVNTTSNDPPLERAYASAVAYGYDMVLYGGNTNIGNILGDVWRFSYTNKTWTKDIFKTTPSTVSVLLPRQYHASDVIGDILYSFGGQARAYGRTTNSLLAYNLTSHEWTVLVHDKAPGPVARQAHSLTAYMDPVLGPSLITFGGYSTQPYNGGFNDVWQFVINKGAWLQLSSENPPPIRYSHEAFLINQTLYIYGGLASYNVTNPPSTDVYYDDVWALTLGGAGNSTWTQVIQDSDPGQRQGHASVTDGTVAYTFGGYVPYQGLADDVWLFNVTKDDAIARF